MARTRNNPPGTGSGGPAPSRFRVRYVFYFTIAVLLVLSVVSYHPADYNTLAGGNDAVPLNWIGNLGAVLAQALFLCCGLGTYLFIALLIFAMLRAFLPGPSNRFRFLGGVSMIMLGALLLLALAPETFASLTAKLGLGRAETARQAIPGGVIGQVLAAPRIESLGIEDGLVRRLIGPVGTAVVGWALVVAGMVMIYLADFHQFVRNAILAGGAVSGGAAASGVPDDDPETISAPSRVAALAAAMEAGGIAAAPAVSEPIATGKGPEKSGGIFGSTRAALAALRNRHNQTAASGDADIAEPPAAAGAAEAPELPEIPPDPAPPSTAPANPAPPLPARAAGMPHAPNSADPETRITEKGSAARVGLFSGYTLPPVSMLGKGPENGGESPESIARAKEVLQQTLDSFKVPGRVAGHISGPRVTRYEIILEPGVNVNKFSALEDNIAMNLAARSVRILAPIPGRPAVGVEAPNSKSEAVFMRSIMESDAWLNCNAGIPIVLGRDVAGRPMVLDLAKAPHLLIAGSTGSGKSVCMNTLIMSMLFRFRPDELKLILVDPKIVEFEDYKTLPHLITPVVNDSRKVPIALRWAVSEMENRYRILASAGVKKLADFNSRPDLDEAVKLLDGTEYRGRMPVLVVIVDELADLMMTEAKKDVETSIARIAQKGRAAGIHMVIATQRPSREIVTGVIRANLPTKIAFTVSKRVDSQVILDQTGAESLLGKGDMLYLPPGCASLDRIQGAMVDDGDIKKVVEFVSQQAPQSFDSRVMSEESDAEEAEAAAESADYDDEDYRDIAPIMQKYLRPGDDENLRKALEIIILERKASISYLQRRLQIGYNRAAELIDRLEERGVIGPESAGGNKREILVFDEVMIGS